MIKQLLVLCLSAFVLAGCSTKGAGPDYFGGQERVKFAFENSEQVPLLIGNFGSFRPNTAGGIDWNVEFINTSKKTIKYITFWTTAYDRVGTRMPDLVGSGSTKSLRYTGPVDAGFTNTYKWSVLVPKSPTMWTNVWYNHSISCTTIDKVEIEYMDGKKVTVDDTDKLMTRQGGCRAYNQS